MVAGAVQSVHKVKFVCTLVVAAALSQAVEKNVCDRRGNCAAFASAMDEIR